MITKYNANKNKRAKKSVTSTSPTSVRTFEYVDTGDKEENLFIVMNNVINKGFKVPTLEEIRRLGLFKFCTEDKLGVFCWTLHINTFRKSKRS